MEGDGAAARHAAERAATGTEDGAAGMRDEGMSSTAVSCAARLDGALDVAGETTARTGSETLGDVGSQGVAQAPMKDTGTAGTSEREVCADAGGAEGRGIMDASDHFEVVERAVASELGAHGMATDGPGEVAIGRGGSTGARAAAACTRNATDDAAVDSGGGTGATVAHVASSTSAGIAEACGHDTPASPTPAGGPKKGGERGVLVTRTRRGTGVRWRRSTANTAPPSWRPSQREDARTRTHSWRITGARRRDRGLGGGTHHREERDILWGRVWLLSC